MNIHPRFPIAAAALTMSLAFAPAAFAQEQPAPAPQEQAQPAEAQSLEGTLVSVDADAKTITVKSEAGDEQTIAYTDTTAVQGAQEGIAGLTNTTDSKVRVMWTNGESGPVALSITVLQ